MKNEDILKQAIEKAKRNNWKPEFGLDEEIEIVLGKLCEAPTNNASLKKTFAEMVFQELTYLILFNHDFAKAFWGSKVEGDALIRIGSGSFYGENWQLQLSMMVLEKEPLKYIERFL